MFEIPARIVLDMIRVRQGNCEFRRSNGLGEMRSNRDSVLLVRGGRPMFRRLIGIQIDLRYAPWP